MDLSSSNRDFAISHRRQCVFCYNSSMYLQYLYIQSLKESKNKVIYVPITNQGLPVLESARFIEDYFTDIDQRYQEYKQQKEQDQ